jgi:hypothetical protein|tara:strand:- start:243 stop:1226 length:984 start_codon:yes stop_codon:yes gene_type:complete
MNSYRVSFFTLSFLFPFLLINVNCSSIDKDDTKIITETNVVNQNDKLNPLLVSNSTGVFRFGIEGFISNNKINVYYHIPNADIKSMPILMSFHGGTRNAEDYRDYWISMANDSNFMVFAPEFDSVDFSSGDQYNLANVFIDGDNPSTDTLNPNKEWTFSVLDPLFEYIINEISGTQESYNGWGHSAGSQFLHRFVLFIPDSKLNIAVCSNAGWYTVPESDVDFPYGLNKSDLSTSTLNLAFSKKLYVHLADLDTNPNASSLRHNEIVDNQQGLNRRARGRYFFSASKEVATQNQIEFNWIKTEEVLNLGHNASEMAIDAVKYLYPKD